MPENLTPEPDDDRHSQDPWPATDTVNAEVDRSMGTTISVEIRLQIGDVRKNVSALAAIDAEDGFKVTRGLLSGLREDANDWLLGMES
jgi:hypothetical protein